MRVRRRPRGAKGKDHLEVVGESSGLKVKSRVGALIRPKESDQVRFQVEGRIREGDYALTPSLSAFKATGRKRANKRERGGVGVQSLGQENTPGHRSFASVEVAVIIEKERRLGQKKDSLTPAAVNLETGIEKKRTTIVLNILRSLSHSGGNRSKNGRMGRGEFAKEEVSAGFHRRTPRRRKSYEGLRAVYPCVVRGGKKRGKSWRDGKAITRQT